MVFNHFVVTQAGVMAKRESGLAGGFEANPGRRQVSLRDTGLAHGLSCWGLAGRGMVGRLHWSGARGGAVFAATGGFAVVYEM
jgi:hypothetical protein